MLQSVLHKLGYKNYLISSCNQKADKWNGLKQSYEEDFDVLIDKNTKINKSMIIKTEEDLNDYEFSMKIPLFNENDSASWYKSGNNDKLAIFGANQIPNANGNPIFATFWLFSSHHNGEKESEFDVFNPTEDVMNIKDYIAGKIKNTEMLTNRYDNGLVQTDYYISKIFELLDKKGYLDNSLVFILGDHGDSVGEHGYYGHGFHLYNEEIRTPLLIYSSDGLKLENSDFATQTDIAPTILDALNINSPKQWEGMSLLGNQEKTISIHERAFSDNEKVMIMQKGDNLYKYFYISKEKEKTVFDDSTEKKLYELYSDPYERSNIINYISNDFRNELKRNFIREFELEKITKTY
jgi:membrane-anchored protein YejM (alkaline phosphatase superfamily)